jgi:pyruvate,water dikinase
VIGRLNRHPAIRVSRLMVMGPGRWGSSNLSLGVNTTYADLSQARVLVELAHERAGQLPDLSFGSHFFQDLVEAQVIYLPVYPEAAADQFNRKFFAAAATALAGLSPEDAGFAGVVKVIDVRRETGGRAARVLADPRSRAAVCWLE